MSRLFEMTFLESTISRGNGYLAQISSFCSTAFEIAMSFKKLL